MTSRERWLAALDLRPVDRLPYWPKILSTYAPNQVEPFRGMSRSELHAWIGSDECILEAPSCARELRSRTRIEVQEHADRRVRVYHTPAGDLTAVDTLGTIGLGSGAVAYHPTEFPVKSLADIEAMRWVYADAQYEFDAAQYDQVRAMLARLGDGGVVGSNVGTSPLMLWLEHLAGMVNGHLLLADYRAEVEALFAEIHLANMRRLEAAADRLPSDFAHVNENTSTTYHSPDQFRRYAKPQLQEYGRVLGAAGKRFVLHMCGKIKTLLPDIAEIPARAVEAMTTSPLGDTAFEDARAVCPDLCLIGGTYAGLWLEPAEVIIETIGRSLDALPHRRGIVVTTAGEIAPGAKPETLKAVAEWLRTAPC